MKATREHVIWAYRLFLDREPESEAVVEQKLNGVNSVAELRDEFLKSAEFQTRSGQLGTYESDTIVLKELGDGLRLYVDISDVHIGQMIIKNSYELAESAFVRQTVQPGDAVVDIGANIGFFTIVLAELVGPGGHVYAFEPLKRNADLLERSSAENRFQHRITLRRAAVGEEAGHIELVSPVATNNWGGGYLRTEATPIPPLHETHRVPLLRLDDCPCAGRVSFIKVDAEGSELLALRGAANLLKRDHPRILCEINAAQLAAVSRASATELIREMIERGYDCHPLTASGLEARIMRYDADEIINVVFVPRSSSTG